MSYKLENIKRSPFKGLNYSTITSDFGYREFWNSVTKKWNKGNHNGIDMTSGTTIVATARGKVTACRNTIQGYTETYSSGNYVTLYHGNNVYTTYCHMKYGSVKVKVGDIVEVGQELGTRGTTGWSTGEHLHYGVRVNGEWADPKPYLLAEKELPQYGEDTPTIPTTHTVVEGDTLTSIATKYNTTVDELVALNELIKIGQVLKLPTSESIKVGDWVVPTRLVSYTGQKLAQYDSKYKVNALADDKATCSALRNGKLVIWASMNVKDLKKVE